MADVSISYKNAEIATMSASGSKTLLTEDCFCEGNIVITYAKPGGGGGETKRVTSNYAFGNWCYVDSNGDARTYAPSGPFDSFSVDCPVGSLISIVSPTPNAPSFTNATLVWSASNNSGDYKWVGTFQVD